MLGTLTGAGKEEEEVKKKPLPISHIINEFTA